MSAQLELAPLDLREMANIAWYRYTSWLQRLAQLPRAQLDLLELNDASSQAREWRGIWCAVERERARLEAARG